jgi:hypothetical protein
VIRVYLAGLSAVLKGVWKGRLGEPLHQLVLVLKPQQLGGRHQYCGEARAHPLNRFAKQPSVGQQIDSLLRHAAPDSHLTFEHPLAGQFQQRLADRIPVDAQIHRQSFLAQFLPRPITAGQ